MIRKYYAFAGATFAMRTCTGGTCSAPNYFLTDQLGSVDVVLDNAGTVLSQQRYLPFGGVRTISGTNVPNPNVPSTDLSYTSQRAIADTGLMDYKARMYSPALGRFIQPDSNVPGAGNPQAFNRYSYVLNDPINLNDPTGHCGRGRGKNGCSESPFGNILGVRAGVLYSSSSLLLIPFGGGGREDDYGLRHPGGGGDGSFSSLSPIPGGGGGPGGEYVGGGGACTMCHIAPDFVTQTNDYTNVSGFIPIFTPFSGITIQGDRDRNGNWYAEIGAWIGTSPGASVSNGYIGFGWDGQVQNESYIESFMTSYSDNLSSSIFDLPVGGSVNWGNIDGFQLDDFSGEVAVMSPGATLSRTYGFEVYDNGSPTPWIWQGDNFYNQLPTDWYH